MAPGRADMAGKMLTDRYKTNLFTRLVDAMINDDYRRVDFSSGIWHCLIRGQKIIFCTFKVITKTCPCNKQRFYEFKKLKIFSCKFLIFFLFLLKT